MMMKIKYKIKLLSIILCLAMLMPTTVQAVNLGSADSFVGHWAEETLTYWYTMGLFDKIPESEFGTNKPVSRGAFVYLFNTMLSIDKYMPDFSKFNDVNVKQWYYDDIMAAQGADYINGYPDDTFRPEKPITREEMCTIIGSYFKLDKAYDDMKLSSFTDKEKIQSYAIDYIGALAELEAVNGYPDGSFQPKNSITYAEAVSIITRFLGYINGGSGVSGRIYSNNKPVYNAEIAIIDHATGNIVKEEKSDVFGDYIIDVTAGTYDISIKKDGLLALLTKVDVDKDIRTYNKIVLEPGQYVTGTLTDSKDKPIADAEITFKGIVTTTETTDKNGVFSAVLPTNEEFVLCTEVDGAQKDIAVFMTTEADDALDLGEIVIESEKGAEDITGQVIMPPMWMIIDKINNSNNVPDIPSDDDSEDDNTDYEDEIPDYSHLPYREPKTMAELIEINGGEMPEIVVDENGNVVSFRGYISNNIVNNSEDVLAELNNISEIIGFNDSRCEFIIDSNYGNIYHFQQIYNKIPVVNCNIMVGVENGRINSIISSYSNIATNINRSSINGSKNDANLIALSYMLEYYDTDATIFSNEIYINKLYDFYIYDIILCSDENIMYKIIINADTMSIYSCTQIEDLTNNRLFNIDKGDQNYFASNIYLGNNTAEFAVGAEQYKLVNVFNPTEYKEYYAFNLENRIGIYDYSSNDIVRNNTEYFPDNHINRNSIMALNNFNAVIDSIYDIIGWKYDNNNGKTKYAVRICNPNNKSFFSQWFDKYQDSVEFAFAPDSVRIRYCRT